MSDKLVCRYAHGLIRSGTCPWCNVPIVEGQPRPEIHPREVANRQWNVAAMLNILAGDDVDARRHLASNLLLKESRPEKLLPVVETALNDADHTVLSLTVQALSRRGREVTANVVSELEQAVQYEPGNVALRLLLLNYYRRAPAELGGRDQYRQHVRWVVENRPDVAVVMGPEIDLDPKQDASVYTEIRHVWLRHIDARQSNAAFIGQAARHFCFREPELAETLLTKAQALEPENPRWREERAHLLSLHQPIAKKLERKTSELSELEEALRLTKKGHKRIPILVDLARAALEEGDVNKAHAYAGESLEESAKLNLCKEEATHYGNLVLGRLALKAGNVDIARRHLLESARTSGSPVQRSFGPNMMLAKELLDIGERSAVIEYLKLCTRFWQTPDHRAEQWIDAIERGLTPDFGANLQY